MENIPIEKSREFLWQLAKEDKVFSLLDKVDKKRKGQDLFYYIVQLYHPYSLYFLQTKALEAKSHSTLLLVVRDYFEATGQDIEKDPEFIKHPHFKDAITHFKKEIQTHYTSDSTTFKELKADALKELIESKSELKTDPETYAKKINCYKLLEETFQNIK